MQGNPHASTRRFCEDPRLARTIKSKRRASVYRSRAALLTRGELVFFLSLRGAVANRCLIMCKVRLADAVTCSEAEWRAGAGNAISQKHLDFVLCDAHSTRFLVAIELDDRSHARPEAPSARPVRRTGPVSGGNPLDSIPRPSEILQARNPQSA